MTARDITFISAGAGSGKTFRLTTLLHDALTGGAAKPHGVLATTFTRKAAAELKERVREDLLSRGRHTLANAMGEALIGTVNSVCGALLERFAFELGLASRLRVLDEDTADVYLRKALDAAIDPAATEAMTEVAMRLEIESWTGVVSDIVSHARLNNISAETLAGFGERNAEDFLAQLMRPSTRTIDDELALAIAAVLPKIQEVAEAEQRKNTATYLEQLVSFQKGLKSGNCRWSEWPKLEKLEPQASLRGEIETIRELLALYPAHPRLHTDIRSYLTLVFGMAAQVLQAYAQSKRELGAIDFADQENLLLAGLDNDDIQDVLRDELDLLMVDEFQDTSPIQLALFMKLAGLAKKTYWVGDIKQAIYGFRGSDTELMKAVLDQLPALGGTKEVLGHSWRSRPALVNVVNRLFVPAFADILARNEVELEPARAETGKQPALMHWSLTGGTTAERAQCLAGGVKELVASGYEVQDKSNGMMRPVRYADIAVLARSNDRINEIVDALRGCGIPSATKQPGLLLRPEAVLALACLRRVLDPNDTLASAEIISLADCAEPEEWLTDRLEWLEQQRESRSWREEGDGAHPVLAALAELRPRLLLMSPREALQAAVAQTGLEAHVLRWCCDDKEARVRLANLDALLEMAAQYEDVCAESRVAATVSGLLLWLAAQAERGVDSLAEPAVDAVRVLTHHGAKGLEWPVVVLHDLEANVRDNLWGTACMSDGPVAADDPLRNRFIRYWPWPFGKMKKVPGIDSVTTCDVAQACREQARSEAVRLLYVSMTRARDCMVLAVSANPKEMPWLETISGKQLLSESVDRLALADDLVVPYATWSLAVPQPVQASADKKPVYWAGPAPTATHLPALISPSAAAGVAVEIEETVELGPRLSLLSPVAMDELGTAIHGCFAVALGASADDYSQADTARILKGYQVQNAIDASALHQAVVRFRDWVRKRWPQARMAAEVPVAWPMANGQLVSGQIDALIDTGTGWVVIDHKSNPEGKSEWCRKANEYGGQLATYVQALEAVTGKAVEGTWLHFPVSGGAVQVAFRRSA